jgi:hypothetical protein
MKRNFAIIVVIILVMIVIGVALYMLSKPSSFFSNTPKTNVQRELAVKQNNTPIQEDFPDADYEANGKWYGLCKKHSIHSIDDFRKTVSSDPVLKTHFADFNWDNAQMGKLEKSIRAYVDYRKNDTIFRKKTPIVLPAGDEYITDGNVTVRTNCCNSYYTTPMNELDAEPAAGPSQLTVTPNNPFSPEPIQIQTLPPPGQVTPLTTAGGNSGNPAIPLPPPVSPPPGYDPPNSSPPNPTPVPATAWIFGTGLVILIGLRRKYKK